MAFFQLARPVTAASGSAAHIRHTVSGIAGSVKAWNDRRVTRNALQRLSDLELDDIGLVRGDIDRI